MDLNKEQSMEFDNLEELLTDELQHLYNMENQIIEALPQIIKAVHTPELKEALSEHLDETKQQAVRLEKAFRILETKIGKKHTAGIEGILKEGIEVIKGQTQSNLKDCAIIGACQKVEHYEIAAYGNAHAYATILDMGEIASLLSESLEEESDADKKLTKIAEGSLFRSGVNKKALKR